MQVPDHLGIIMDGNGRWATSRGLPRSKGHLEGLKTTRKIVRAASEAGLRHLSLYVFSTENWKRSAEEVKYLMSLVAKHLEKELDFYHALGLRVVHSGDRPALPREVLKALDRTVELTSTHQGMVVNLALNYGGRDELLRAMERWQGAGGRGRPTEEDLRKAFDAPELPDVDLVIRTGGELRLSNFLLWQTAYAEFVFSPILWPDFTEEDLREALRDFAGRDRRFGKAPELAARPAGRRLEAPPRLAG
ncbi:MAG TPA: polyprenyl diphosphate synthase [Rectinemataceae bacterium]|nr:polyprenyl diphosphate synthase [Rectinemataceae bacterium]